MADSKPLKTHAAKLSGFLGLQRSTLGVLAMVVLVGMGERMAERFPPIYILALGGSTLVIGLLQAMDNFLSALYSFPGGYLADRLGTKKALILFNLVAMGGFALVMLFPAWQTVLVYIPVAYLADRSAKKPFVVITFFFFSIFHRGLLFSRSFPGLVAAFILRGLKEFGEPTRKSLITGPSLESCKDGMFGLYYLIRDVVVAFAALGGAFLWRINPQTNLLSAFAFGIIGTAGHALWGRDIQLPEKKNPEGTNSTVAESVLGKVAPGRFRIQDRDRDGRYTRLGTSRRDGREGGISEMPIRSAAGGVSIYPGDNVELQFAQNAHG